MKKLGILILLPIFIFLLTSFTNNKSTYIVLDTNTHRILKGEGINDQLLVASTAKILTAITVIENYNIEEEIIIKKEYTEAVGSSVYLKENDIISRKELLYALMLRSANDAASALSDNDSNEFIILMNETAKKIGMRKSIFFNASGLDEREYNLSTAYDMALLTAYASKIPTFVEIASTYSYKCETNNNNNYYWVNKHKLVNSSNNWVFGKTGYTKRAKRILISNYKDSNMDVVIVTINNSDDWNFHKEIINNLEDYDFVSIFNKGIHKITFDKDYYIYIKNDIYIPLKENEYQRIKIKFKLSTIKVVIEIYLDGVLIYSEDLKVLNEKNLD